MSAIMTFLGVIGLLSSFYERFPADPRIVTVASVVFIIVGLSVATFSLIKRRRETKQLTQEQPEPMQSQDQ
jgi:multisubunit Na+/H+ antiporter MnhG subunit